jgi:Undecaprenyl-phosphate glucose phosphotransferase
MSHVSPQFSPRPAPTSPHPIVGGSAVASGERRLSVVAMQLALRECLTLATLSYGVTAFYFGAVLHTASIPSRHFFLILAIAVLELAIVLSCRQYARLHDESRDLFCWSGLASVVAAFSLILSTVYLLQMELEFSRGALVLQLLTISVAVPVARAMHHSRLQAMLRSGEIDSRRVILIGDAGHCRSAALRLRAGGVSTIQSFAYPPAASVDPLHRRALIDGLIRECRKLAADDVIIVTDQPLGDATVEVAQQFAELPMSVQVMPVGFLDAMSRCRIIRCGDALALGLYDRPLSAFDRAVKRAFDIAAAGMGLLLLLPFFTLIAIAIKLDTRGPIIFAQRRHGYNNVPFRMFKFRTMTVLEDGNDFRQATRHDRRITRIGRILRRSSIDELPQLYNVLIGDMSTVGPRPHAIAHNERFDGVIASFWRRHNVKPGITGWAQAHGYRGETSTLDVMKRRIEYDLYYIERWSFWLDIKIILMTLLSKASRANAH